METISHCSSKSPNKDSSFPPYHLPLPTTPRQFIYHLALPLPQYGQLSTSPAIPQFKLVQLYLGYSKQDSWALSSTSAP